MQLSYHTIEYKSFLINIHADGSASTYFDSFKSERAAKIGVTKYAKQFNRKD